MNAMKTLSAMCGAAILLTAGGAAASDLGTCKVKVKVSNKCASNAELIYINFWHKSVKNKYSIPTLGFRVLGGDKSETFTYNVLMACHAAKKVEAQYKRPKDSSMFAKWVTENVQNSDWQKGSEISIDLDKCH